MADARAKARWEVEEPGALPSADPPEQRLPREPGVFLELQAKSADRQGAAQEGQRLAPTWTPPKSSRNRPGASFGAIQAVCTRPLTPFPMELQLEGKQTPAGDRRLSPSSSWGPAPPRAELFPKEEKPTPWQRRGRTGPSMLWTMRAGKDSVNPSLDLHLRCVQQILRFHFIGVNHLYGACRDLQESG